MLPLFSCPKKFEYSIIITDHPANLYELNSEFDDYNLDLSYSAKRLDIYFSSNRNSSGNDFDIIGQCMDISYHEEDNILNLNIANDYPIYSYKLLPLINTNNNEMGPYSFTTSDDIYIFMYAQDGDNVLNIKYVYTNTYDWGHYQSKQTIYGPFIATILNSTKDDSYPMLCFSNNEILFCSNRNDNCYNIFKALIPNTDDILTVFNDTTNVEIRKDSIISSLADDKCPSINNNLLVFASNREGGFGGFDLWYSQLTDNLWSTPKNFGSKINSEYDEFRPVTFQFLDNDLMVFSSNRPGGKGGFDLYCVKIEKMIN